MNGLESGGEVLGFLLYLPVKGANYATKLFTDGSNGETRRE